MAIDALIRWFPHRPVAALRPPGLGPFDPTDFSPSLCTRLLILQPTPFCNLDCDYCYLPERSSTARMRLATVRQAAQRLLDDGLLSDELSVVWHAGEPLVVPVEWYDDAIAAIREVLGPHCRISHSFQTNATLINDTWCALIRRHDIKVGVSVDGPADLHDAHRRTRSGKGTHARVLRGMECLRAHGIAFHAITVVGPATFAQADAFFDFFEAQGIEEVGCNFDEAEGVHTTSSVAGHEAAHAAFLARLLDRSSAQGSGVRIRELSVALQLIAQPLPSFIWRGLRWPYNLQTQPFALISVAHNGDFSTFSPELLGQPSIEFGDFVFGNVARIGFLESARSEHFKHVWSEIVRGMRACEASCAHYGFCGGGAPANKLYENGDFGGAETLYCRTMVKRPFDAVLTHLEREYGHSRHAPATRSGLTRSKERA